MQSGRKNDGGQSPTILEGIASNCGDWGTAIALFAIGILLGYSVYQTVTGDLGYLVDAFT